MFTDITKRWLHKRCWVVRLDTCACICCSPSRGCLNGVWMRACQLNPFIRETLQGAVLVSCTRCLLRAGYHQPLFHLLAHCCLSLTPHRSGTSVSLIEGFDCISTHSILGYSIWVNSISGKQTVSTMYFKWWELAVVCPCLLSRLLYISTFMLDVDTVSPLECEFPGIVCVSQLEVRDSVSGTVGTSFFNQC